MSIPADPKIYHIFHVDRLDSIVADGCLWCDAEVQRRGLGGTNIGMNDIKRRRLTELKLASHPNLFVGDCVPFYFCPRSVMLYLIYKANNQDLQYKGGQGWIIHLEADLRQTVAWAQKQGRRWAFTLSNAGARYFEDRCRLDQLGEINWTAVQARDWRGLQDGKQAEFLIEYQFPWHLVSRIGVSSRGTYTRVLTAVKQAEHQPRVEIKPDWYY